QEGFVLVQRVAAAIGNQFFGQNHGQVFFWNRNRAAIFAVDDRDRGAPVTLTGNAPVAQTIGSLFLAQFLGVQVCGNGIHGRDVCQAVVLAGIDGLTLLLVAVPVLPLGGVVFLAFYTNDLIDRQLVFQGKGEVALVVSRHAHHGAVTVAHQD